MANWWPLEFVDEESTTVADTDESLPAAAIITPTTTDHPIPVKTNFDSADLTSGRMTS